MQEKVLHFKKKLIEEQQINEMEKKIYGKMEGEEGDKPIYF